MDRESRQSGNLRQQTVEAVATFTALMHARERGEPAKAAAARQELERLGIAVRFSGTIADARKAVAHD